MTKKDTDSESAKVPWDTPEKGPAKKKEPPKKKKPPKSVCVKTIVPRLINLVSNDSRIKYLLKIDNKLCIEEFVAVNGVTYQPKQDLPIKYITPDILDLELKKELNCKLIMNMVLSFIKKHLEMPGEQDYIVLALWVFHTYLIEKFDVTPILYFYGTKATGKTRAGEILAELSYKGERLTSPTEASLFRSADAFKTTLVIDEIKLWGKDGRQDVADLIKSRYKRGLKVSRVNLNKKGEDQLEYFDVFAPLVICTTESIPSIIESRCITFIMQQNVDSNVENKIDEIEANELRKLLTIFRFYHFDNELPEPEPIARRRLNEITYPLLQICELVDPDKREDIIDFVKYLEMQKATEESEMLEAEIVKCLKEAEGLIFANNKISTTELTNEVNKDRSDKEKYSSKYISYCMRRMGFEKTRLSDGKAGFKYTKSLLDKLTLMYNIGTE